MRSISGINARPVERITEHLAMNESRTYTFLRDCEVLHHTLKWSFYLISENYPVNECTFNVTLNIDIFNYLIIIDLYLQHLLKRYTDELLLH